MNKHSFGFLSQCVVCKNNVPELWGTTLESVLDGNGLCEACMTASKTGETDLQKLTTLEVLPVMEVKTDEFRVDRDNISTERDSGDQ